MPILHDIQTRDALKARAQSLRPDAERRWGRMTVDQMLWHVNCALEYALGRFHVEDQRLPLPYPVVKFIVLNIPWRRGKTPTAPEFVARERYDFAQEHARLLRLIDEVTGKPIDAEWGRSSFMGKMTGHDWSRLQAKPRSPPLPIRGMTIRADFVPRLAPYGRTQIAQIARMNTV